jgi:hypothetical protein
VVEGNSGTRSATFTVTLSAASALPVSVRYATADGSATAASGDYVGAPLTTLTFAPGETSKTVTVVINGDYAREASETFFLNLSAPTNATLADPQASATILNDDATKFFAVDDGSTDRTYRYNPSGGAVSNSTLTSGDTAPRGAASNASGTTVWVVDANKTVYVYGAGGNLLGSWAAGGLGSTAQVEGIAVDPNGTDVWLVDNKQDKVFKYAGAATRLSGSQNAASSFALASGNTSPKDIVTDGTSLWVVNDAAPDKVFKYTLTGTLLGSWTIDSANAAPTGITLDPSDVRHLWIVDSGTDRVYQYDDAASRTSGSQNAAAIFALAPGDTNPQGIADPPTAEMDLTTSPHPGSITNANTQTDVSVNGQGPDSLFPSAGSVASLRFGSGGPAPFPADPGGFLAVAGDRVSLPSGARGGFPTSTLGVVGMGQPQGTFSVSMPRLVFPWNTDSAAVDLGFSVGEDPASVEVSAEPLGSKVLDLFFAGLGEGSDVADLSATP